MIKQQLKELDITLLELAKSLYLSRPTLDNYIALHDSGKRIPKDKYEIIFNRLFEETKNTREDFLKELERCKILLEKDKVLETGDLSAEDTDLIMKIMDNIRIDIKQGQYDKEFYDFILMLINGYRQQEVYKKIARYFLLLNGVSNIETIKSDEKVFLSKFYPFMMQYVNNEIIYDEISYQQFLKRIHEVKDLVEEGEKKIKAELKERINKILTEKKSLGENLEQLSVDDLLKELIQD